MKKVLLSFAVGESYNEMFSITQPSMQQYSLEHGYVVVVQSTKDLLDTSRPPSWWKVEAIMRCFLDEADVVLWMDADVLICKGSADIVHTLGQEDLMGCVVHQTCSHGTVPNCGVWLMKKEFAPYLLKLNRLGHRPDASRNRFDLWEQDALLEMMGGTYNFPITLPKIKTFPWKELSYKWNVVPFDKRGIIDDAMFIHATGTKSINERIKLLETFKEKSL